VQLSKENLSVSVKENKPINPSDRFCERNRIEWAFHVILDANQDFNFELERLESVACLRLSQGNVGKILAGREPLPRKQDERHSRPTYLSRQDLWNTLLPSVSTRIRAWKDVPAWPIDTQDNTGIKKRRRWDRVCYFWINYSCDIKANPICKRECSFDVVSSTEYVF